MPLQTPIRLAYTELADRRTLSVTWCFALLLVAPHKLVRIDLACQIDIVLSVATLRSVVAGSVNRSDNSNKRNGNIGPT